MKSIDYKLAFECLSSFIDRGRNMGYDPIDATYISDNYCKLVNSYGTDSWEGQLRVWNSTLCQEILSTLRLNYYKWWE